MKDKRICQLLLVPFMIFELSRDGKDYRSRRCREYIGLIVRLILPIDKSSKLSKRIARSQFNILNFCASDGKYSGHKVLLILFYLTQLIFDEKEHINPKEHNVMRRVKFILEFALKWEARERFERLNTEEDFEKLQKSSEKQASKIFNKFYQEI